MGEFVDVLVAKLSSVAVAPHVRVVDGKPVKVKAYVREQSLVAKLRDTGPEGGGFSVRSGNKTPKTGFMVALPGAEEKFSIKDLTDEDIALYLMRYQLKHKDDLKGKNRFFGGWLDRDDGMVYLDVSENVQDRDEAIRLGRERKQKVIFDLNTFEDIRTDDEVVKASRVDVLEALLDRRVRRIYGGGSHG